MNGYLIPKFKKERKEIHGLNLEDCDFVSDDEENPNPVTTTRKYRCHRCGATTHIHGNAPYCSDCNWDSLTDLTFRKNNWKKTIL